MDTVKKKRGEKRKREKRKREERPSLMGWCISMSLDVTVYRPIHHQKSEEEGKQHRGKPKAVEIVLMTCV